jgi:hypothetical protein
MSSLPRSVRNQAKTASTHFEDLEKDPEAPAATPEPETDQDIEKTEPEKQPVEADESKQAKQEEKPQEDRDASYWRNRFNVLRGKYDSEVPTLHTKVRELTSQLAESEKALVKARSEGAGTDSAVPDEKLAEFKDTFGEELVDFVTRMIEQRSEPKQQDDNVEKLSERLNRIEEEKRQEAEANFWTDLSRVVPEFQKINQEPGFLQFLAGYDPSSGKQYQTELGESQRNLDARGVADIFKLYLSQSEAKSPKAEKDEDVSPRRAGGGDPVAASAASGRGKIWTGADIDKFYRDKSAGKVKGDEAERLEADIFAAQKEGRIRR